MTDNEIIKMLEKHADYDCNHCPDNDEWCEGEDCIVTISKNALDLIKRQMTEIDRIIDKFNSIPN